MNKIILVGRLTRDPETKDVNGKTVANFTVAVDRRFKNKDGQKETDFVPVVVWGKSAEFCGSYLNKGDQISLAGRLQVRNYDDRDGNKRYITEVVADEVNSLGSKKDKDSPIPDQLGGGVDKDFHLMSSGDDVPF